MKKSEKANKQKSCKLKIREWNFFVIFRFFNFIFWIFHLTIFKLAFFDFTDPFSFLFSDLFIFSFIKLPIDLLRSATNQFVLISTSN